MSGLENICGKILSDAKATADEILQKAKKQAEQARLSTEGEIARLRENAEGEMAREEALAKESLDRKLLSKRRDALLKAEQTAVLEIIDEAKKRILSYSDKEYFELLKDIYKNNAEDKEGEILFTKSDREHMSKDFLKTLCAQKGKLRLSLEDAPSAGFVLRYGKISENCTFDAIFSANRNRFFDIALKCLKG